MVRLPQEHLDSIVDIMLANQTETGAADIGSVDLAEMVDMLGSDGKISRTFYSAMRQLVDAKRVVQTRPTPYARWAAVRPTPVRESAVTNDERAAFVVTVDIEEAESEAIVVNADSKKQAIELAKIWLKSIDFDNLDGVTFTAREYASVHVIR